MQCTAGEQIGRRDVQPEPKAREAEQSGIKQGKCKATPLPEKKKKRHLINLR